VLAYYTCGDTGIGFISDTFGLNYSAVTAATGINGNCNFKNNHVETRVASTGSSTGSDTFNVSAATGNTAAVLFIAAEYSGPIIPITQDPIGGVGASCASGCGGTSSSGNLTTTLPGDLLLSVAMPFGGSIAPSGGSVLRTTGIIPDACACGGNAATLYLADAVSGVAGTYAGTWTNTGVTQWFAELTSLSFVAPSGVRHRAKVIRYKNRPKPEILLAKAGVR
jgi:hypothetical protein